MTSKRITWDPTKAATNLQKHKVSFGEGATVLSDEHTVWSPDMEHGELRFNVVGYSNQGRVLFVVTVETNEDAFRIISARKATSHERKRHEAR
jgi:uncharacterized DUF497 family protein